MSGMFGYSREAVRVKVKKYDTTSTSTSPEYRKFSVDPQITSFEVLQSILGKAFDIKEEFSICYKIYDVHGQETYLPIVSDWDLDAAFLKVHNMSIMNGCEPLLVLRVDIKPFHSSPDCDSTLVASIKSNLKLTSAQEAKPSRFSGLKDKMGMMGRTINMMQKAIFGEDGVVNQLPPRAPLCDAEFRQYQNAAGQIIDSKTLRNVIYYGGIEPSLRKVIWKHILNVYPEGMSGRERISYIKRKADEYFALREKWKSVVQKGEVTGDLAYTTGMVRKDVLRTDRHHEFYAGSDDNQNIASLFNILTTYALNHPKVSYCQGMSDLASPLLVTMSDEAHAYICFCALMVRLSTNFMLDGIAMSQKFTHLAQGLNEYDPDFYDYLKAHQAEDLLFCYRWLLLEMKREFAFEDSLRMLEVLWSSLPASPPQKELPLFDVRFIPDLQTPPISPLVKTPRESPYTNILAIRRQSSSISLFAAGLPKVAVKRQNHSLDETTASSRSARKVRSKVHSLDDASLAKSGDGAAKKTAVVKGFFAPSKQRLFASLEKLDRGNSIKEEQEAENRGVASKKIADLNAFKAFGPITVPQPQDNPSIVLTRSSADRRLSSDCDTSSAEDSQEYGPLTTSVTREARHDLEQLNRRMAEMGVRQEAVPEDSPSRGDAPADTFVWENPLMGEKDSCPETPDEQAELEYDSPAASGGTTAGLGHFSGALPPPEEFGGGNPFLMFLSITLLMQHRNFVMQNKMDYNEMAMHFDKMVRRHNVTKVLNQARQMYAEYLRRFAHNGEPA